MVPLLAYLGRFLVSSVAEKAIRVAAPIAPVADATMPSPIVSGPVADPLRSDNDVQLAREMVIAPSHDSWFDVLVDGAARLPRPVMAFWVMGMLFGLITPPNLNAMGPKLLTWIEYIMGFYFGHRAMARDIPILVSSITNALRK